LTAFAYQTKRLRRTNVLSRLNAINECPAVISKQSMEPDNWKTIKDVVLEALELDASRRREFLDQAGISADTRAEVESLLGLAEEAEDFMSLSVGEFSKDFLEDLVPSPSPVINQRIGVYQIVSELGVGGMGAVYLATRVDGKFEQRVAVKMLKREFNTEKFRRTFKREKEILAALAHPNIATLLDAGTTDDGIPYLVMEYVKGEPIDEFCESRKLSLNARLKLFNKVCDAVAFAHRNLIIHRDLKPSNVLVNEDGEPKLLDFGISKLLDANADDHVTHFEALTPQYASPEQINRGPVTTATDVYSLGVVLFRILTGSLPYRLGHKTNGNLLLEITEAAPALPSKAALTPVTSHQLKGDLDNIILKSLSKEPERRYQTVEQFSADIWRYVDGLPVLARPATLFYRAGKFYKRNKVTVSAVALFLIGLFAAVAVAWSQANAAKKQARMVAEARTQAELEATKAKAEAQKAQRTSRFLQSLLDYANPNWYARGKGRFDVTVREAIDDAAGRIDTELADDPVVRADLHYTIGEIYNEAGEAEIALRHFRQSLDLYREVYGEQHPKVARGLYYVTLLMRATGSSLEEVEPLLRQGITIMRTTGPDDVNLPYMLQTLAGRIMTGERERRDEGRLAEAESMILEEKSLFLRHYGANHGSTVSADSDLATLALTRGDLARAEQIREEVLKRDQQDREGSYGHIWSLVNLAEVKLARGKAAEARTLLDQATELGRRQWGAHDIRFERLEKSIKALRAPH
jgi:serine/threonine-protein kinase